MWEQTVQLGETGGWRRCSLCSRVATPYPPPPFCRHRGITSWARPRRHGPPRLTTRWVFPQTTFPTKVRDNRPLSTVRHSVFRKKRIISLCGVSSRSNTNFQSQSPSYYVGSRKYLTLERCFSTRGSGRLSRKPGVRVSVTTGEFATIIIFVITMTGIRFQAGWGFLLQLTRLNGLRGRAVSRLRGVVLRYEGNLLLLLLFLRYIISLSSSHMSLFCAVIWA